jgi:hypothetical protein
MINSHLLINKIRRIKNMTSLKKPFIAIASAVVLAATMIAAPANASITAAVTVGETDVATTSKVITTPATPTVPADNKVELADTVKFVVTVANNTVVSAVATNAKLVSALHTTDAPVTSASGSATISGNSGSGTTVTFYAFTTKSTTGSVVVSTGGSSTTYYLEGVAGSAYNLSVVAPRVSTLSATSPVTATVTDVFGNAVTDASISNVVIRGAVGSFSYVDADKVYKATFTAPATSGDAIIESKITVTAVTGLPKPVDSVVYTITVGDLAEQVAVLTSKLTKAEKKFNKLAKRWNKANPTKKVKLIK